MAIVYSVDCFDFRLEGIPSGRQPVSGRQVQGSFSPKLGEVVAVALCDPSAVAVANTLCLGLSFPKALAKLRNAFEDLKKTRWIMLINSKT